MTKDLFYGKSRWIISFFFFLHLQRVQQTVVNLVLPSLVMLMPILLFMNFLRLLDKVVREPYWTCTLDVVLCRLGFALVPTVVVLNLLL